MALQNISLNRIASEADSAMREANSLADSMLRQVMQFSDTKKPVQMAPRQPNSGQMQILEIMKDLQKKLSPQEADEVGAILQESQNLPPGQQEYFNTFLMDNYATPKSVS